MSEWKVTTTSVTWFKGTLFDATGETREPVAFKLNDVWMFEGSIKLRGLVDLCDTVKVHFNNGSSVVVECSYAEFEALFFKESQLDEGRPYEG